MLFLMSYPIIPKNVPLLASHPNQSKTRLFHMNVSLLFRYYYYYIIMDPAFRLNAFLTRWRARFLFEILKNDFYLII